MSRHFSALLTGTALAAALVLACDRPREARAPGVRDTVVGRFRWAVSDTTDYRIGSRGNGRGGDFDVQVGKDFGRDQAREVLRRLIALESDGEFKQFTCGDSAPHIRFDITLHQQRAGQQPTVTVGHSPELFLWGPQRCLTFGVNYLVARTFAQVDSGPSVVSGYRVPTTNKDTGTGAAGARHTRHWPTCNCAMSRDSAWVKNGPRETSIGANAH